jgi:peptidoglycan/xylan/chitin deacetylase (PgdA/CDA1 family)
MYHRVLPPEHPSRAIEQPGMYVSPETLRMHLRVLRRHFDVLDLHQWIRLRAQGARLPRRACAVTFDDGWRDNFDYAFPVLREAGIPATIFLVAGAIGASYSFWPNKVARALGALKAVEPWRQWLVGAKEVGVVHRAWSQLGPPFDVVTIDAVISQLKTLPDVVNVALADSLERLVEIADTAVERDMLDAREIGTMRASGLVRFGSHTCRHIRLLASLEQSVLQYEVQQSRRDLEARLGEPVELFCYPNGDHSPAAVEAVRSSYAAAVTTREGWNDEHSDMHLLRRIGVHEDVSSDPRHFLARLSGLV